MSFAQRELGVLAFTNGFTLWHYTLRDGVMASIREPNFFGSAADMMAARDMVVVSASDGGAVYFVVSANAGHVVIASLEAA